MHHNESFSRLKSKLDCTEKHDSDFGKLSMQKGGSFQKEWFIFFSIVDGFFLTSHPRAYATLYAIKKNSYLFIYLLLHSNRNDKNAFQATHRKS